MNIKSCKFKNSCGTMKKERF